MDRASMRIFAWAQFIKGARAKQQTDVRLIATLKYLLNGHARVWLTMSWRQDDQKVTHITTDGKEPKPFWHRKQYEHTRHTYEHNPSA